MAIGATIIKARLQLANMDTHLYQDFNLTLAQHPSENEQRLMVRLLAFALNASDELMFTKGLSSDDEPELWAKSMTDEIDLWVELGTPEEKRLKKACSRAKKVVLYTYGGGTADVWWKQNQKQASKLSKLTVVNLPLEQTQELAAMCQKSMDIQVSIQDGEVLVSSEQGSVAVTPIILQ
ncbi:MULTISPECIES: YaeQ family protein [unclassified Motilimonas]|uniref:YaeQ family protein n=1 Tax=Motilimonas TaxID=1914248 RepID=UPI001E2B2927|nr:MULTISPECIES: YaeQ family protein [unclassified Motilimonas]MCE0558244.1 YaeQ family protein [Motilimonas sp. E26]MDO6526424.1 YaeQ family protein [Motilimonas sp. 1_MG-2023]